jgi:arylsulfatase A-like enzyme
MGLDRQTIAFFSSDNGPWLIKKEAGGSAGLLREGKASTWEGGVREPFLARWPGKIPAGVTTQAFGTLMDLFPTCARLGAGKTPGDRVYDGVDLGPVLFEGHPGREARHFYYVDTELRAVRRGPWKLHLRSASPASAQPQPVDHNPPLLFHLLEDPSEKYDVAAAHPEVVRELTALAAEHRAGMQPGVLQR